MVVPTPSPNTATSNERSLSTLVRAITLSQGSFSLILAYSNSPTLRQTAIEQLRKLCPIPIREVTLPKTTATLYTSLQKEIGEEQPQAVMVLNLHALIALDRVLLSANIVRDEFRKTWHCPLILWVTDDILRKMIRLAPDFENWAATTIRFVPTQGEKPKTMHPENQGQDTRSHRSVVL